MSVIENIKDRLRKVKEKVVLEARRADYVRKEVVDNHREIVSDVQNTMRDVREKSVGAVYNAYGKTKDIVSSEYKTAKHAKKLFMEGHRETVASVKDAYGKTKEEYNLLKSTANIIKNDAGEIIKGEKQKIQDFGSKVSKQFNPEVVASVKSGIKARASQVQKTSIAHDVGYGGNLFIRSMTGIRSGEKNPYKGVSSKTRAAVARAQGKKIKLGRKLSKKEIKGLQAKYGKNWKMAVQQDKQGNFSSQVSPQQRVGIQRENRVDFNRTNIGGGSINNQFPITSEYANVPFGARADVPTDVEGMFLGERGSGLADRSAPRTDYGFGSGLKDIGNNSLFGSSEIKKQKTGTIEFKF